MEQARKPDLSSPNVPEADGRGTSRKGMAGIYGTGDSSERPNNIQWLAWRGTRMATTNDDTTEEANGLGCGGTETRTIRWARTVYRNGMGDKRKGQNRNTKIHAASNPPPPPGGIQPAMTNGRRGGKAPAV